MINWDIVPFESVGKFKLYSSVEDVKKILDDEKFSYSEEIREHKDFTHPVPWLNIKVNNVISFWFVKDKLFEISLKENFKGSLPNGIYVGMSIEKAKKIDSKLEFNEWDEIWESTLGYWLEDIVATKKIVSIIIFVKEVLDYDLFEKYEWC